MCLIFHYCFWKSFYVMFYACLATMFCICVGLTGILLSLHDIERFNFGLYLALLSVVGSTVSVAFWIISPTICGNPKCVQKRIDRYAYKFDPIRNFVRRHFRTKRRTGRKRISSRVDDVTGERKYRKRNKKSLRTKQEEDCLLTNEVNEDESDLLTSSSGYHSPNQTAPAEQTTRAHSMYESLVDETVRSPKGRIVFVPYQIKKTGSIGHSVSAYTIVGTSQPLIRTNSMQTFV